MKNLVCRYKKARGGKRRKRDAQGRFVKRSPWAINWRTDNRILLIAVCVFVFGPLAVEAVKPAGFSFSSMMGGSTSNSETLRKRDNAARLQKISPTIRPKIAAVISDMEREGYQPLIDSGVWRSPSEQAAKVRAGYSKTLFSFHTATTRDGKADALAADITDKRWGWNSSAQNRVYWLKLASAAQSHNLTTGIYWGLSTANRAKLRQAIQSKNWKYSGPLGWDTAHVEVTGITVSQARAGVRPKIAPVAPLLVINGKPIRRGAAYFANGSWFVIEGDLAPLFGKAASTPALSIPLRAALDSYGQTIVATSNRLTDRNRYDVRTAPKK